VIFFFFKFLCSVRGSHCDCSPRAPRKLATPLSLGTWFQSHTVYWLLWQKFVKITIFGDDLHADNEDRKAFYNLCTLLQVFNVSYLVKKKKTILLYVAVKHHIAVVVWIAVHAPFRNQQNILKYIATPPSLLSVQQLSSFHTGDTVLTPELI